MQVLMTLSYQNSDPGRGGQQVWYQNPWGLGPVYFPTHRNGSDPFFQIVVCFIPQGCGWE